MKITFFATLSAFVFLLLFAGCETTSSQNAGGDVAVRLNGNPFEHGERVRHTIRFEGQGGKLQTELGRQISESSIRFWRYQVVDEFRAVFRDGQKVETNFALIDDYSEGEWSGEGESVKSVQTSPLRGYSFHGELEGDDWSFELNGGDANTEQREELEGIIYHLRSSLPAEAKVGDSWTRTPLFVNAFLRRELRNVEGGAVFTLQKVEETADGRRALIGLKINSSGDEVQSDGSISVVRLSLEGTVALSLDTFLQSEISLEGEMSGSVGFSGASRSYVIPIRVSAQESFVDGDERFGGF